MMVRAIAYAHNRRRNTQIRLGIFGRQYINLHVVTFLDVGKIFCERAYFGTKARAKPRYEENIKVNIRWCLLQHPDIIYTSGFLYE